MYQNDLHACRSPLQLDNYQQVSYQQGSHQSSSYSQPNLLNSVTNSLPLQRSSVILPADLLGFNSIPGFKLVTSSELTCNQLKSV